MIDPERRLRTARRAHLVWASVVVGVVLVMLGMAASTEQPEGVCSGIGWGCELSGTDLASLVAIMIVPIAVAVLLVGHLLIATIGRFVKQRRG